MNNFFVVILLIGSLFSGCVNARYDPTDVNSLYESLSVEDLSMRFTQPQLYEGRDDFAKGNALCQIVRRGLIRQGMTSEQIWRILGYPDIAPSSITVGEPYKASYTYKYVDLTIEYSPKRKATRVLWSVTSYTPESSNNFTTVTREY